MDVEKYFDNDLDATECGLNKNAASQLSKESGQQWLKKERPSVYSDCEITLGNLTLCSTEWSQIFDENVNKLRSTEYPTVTIEKIVEKFKLGCVLIVRDYKKLRKRCVLEIKYFCNHVDCPCKYVLRLQEYPSKGCDALFRLLTNTKKIVHGDYPLARQCKGLARNQFMDKLEHNNAVNVTNDAIVKADKVVIERGYLPKIYSDDVARKVKSEGLAKKSNRLDSDDFTSVRKKLEIELQKAKSGDESNFIQELRIPIRCVLYCKEQLQLVSSLKVKIGYFDATGSMCKKLGEGEVYYYTIVTQMEGKTLPLIEFFSENHNNVDIGEPLRKLLYDWKHRFTLKEPMLSDIVIDFSWAMLKATLSSFNAMTAVQYLQYCYMVDAGERKASTLITHIHICVAHIMKKVAELAAKTIKEKKCKAFAKEIFAKIIDTTSISACLKMENYYTLLLTEKETPNVKECLKKLLDIVCKGKHDVEKDTSENCKDDENKPVDNEIITKEMKTVYLQSRYYQIFEQLRQKIANNTEDCVECDEAQPVKPNEYYCVEFADKITKRYFSYLPLINGAMIPKKYKIIRLSNALVEGFNKLRKHEIMEKKRNITLDANIEISRQYVKAKVTQFQLNIRSKNTTKNPAIKRKRQDSEEEDTNKNETWKKSSGMDFVNGKSVKKTHFDGKKLNKLKDELACELQIELIKNPAEIEDDNVSTISHAKSIEHDITILSDCEDNERIIIAEEANEIDVQTSEKELVVKGDMSIKCLLTPARRYSHRKSEGLPPKQKLLENGLVDNPYYYKKSAKLKNYVMCLYGEYDDISIGEKKRQVMVKSYNKLSDQEKKKIRCREVNGFLMHFDYEHFECVQDNKRKLLNTTLDTYFILILKKHDKLKRYLAVSCEFSYFLLRSNKMRATCQYAIKNVSREYQCIAIPVLVDDHFYMYVIDFMSREIRYYDSLPGAVSLERKKELLDAIKVNFLDQYNVLQLDEIDVETYRVKTVVCPRQLDAIQCGVAVCYFAHQEVKSEDVDIFYSIPNFRREMMNLILEMSCNVANLCVLCGENDIHADDSNWVQCDDCDRWYHSHCIQKTHKISTSTLAEDKYSCMLCEMNEKT